MGKLKTPGRVRLLCIKCEKEFSTHSTNRKHCHKCLPKCTERHEFLSRAINIENKAGKTKKNIEQVIQVDLDKAKKVEEKV